MLPAPLPHFDLVLVGGGLQGGLLALAVLERNPGARVALVERGPRVGGNHTWSFHAGDVPAAAERVVEPLIDASWPAYDVAFPGLERTLASPYRTISSARFATVVEERFARAPGSLLLTGTGASDVQPDSVTLDDGRRIQAPLVIDARGPERASLGTVAGYQKFVGLELELEATSPVTRPMLMDARVPQTDGFRFFYVLPLAERRVLVEDTYFADGSRLDVPALRSEVLAYAGRQGLRVARVLREETGVLPLPVRGLGEAPSASPLSAGYGGGFFHPVTGYSFPVALRVALHVAKHLGPGAFGREWDALLGEHRRQFRFGAHLNRLLFRAFRPEDRWNVLERFYRLPEPTIRRFYALTTTPTDRLRIFCGRPPRGFSLRVPSPIGAGALP